MSRHPSIRRRLLGMLISTLLVVWLVVLVLVYRAAQHEVEEVFDADMARSARILQSLLAYEVNEEQEVRRKAREVMDELGDDIMRDHPRLLEILRESVAAEEKERVEIAMLARDAAHRYGSGLMFIARHADGRIMMRDRTAPDIPRSPPGYSDLSIGGEAWRVFSLVDPQTGFTVQVGERGAFRDELVGYITRNTLMPLLVALPLLAILVWVMVGRALVPLQRVAHEVSQRAADALAPIPDGDAPSEIHGLVGALNRLFTRLAAAIARERQFTADAAHELRTPLAALKAHLQVAQAKSAEPAARDFLRQAIVAVDRTTHSVEQLLQLARADAEGARTAVTGSVDLRELAIDAVAAFSQQALDHEIDLGVEAEQPVPLKGDAVALQILLRNLVDNALRYTPAGGTVTVSAGLTGGDGWLRVADDGPGVAPEEREHVFERFHRGPDEQARGTTGSGLGLSIVRRIAELHDARVELGEGLDGRGLGVTVRFASA